MRTWSLPAGSILGVEIRIHLAFFFLLVFVWMAEGGSLGYHGPWRGLALVGIIFASVVVHELGHAIASYGGRGPRAIMLLPLGGVPFSDTPAEREPAPQLVREFAISAAGPVLNLVVAGAAAILLMGIAPEVQLMHRPLVYSGALLRSLVWVNVMLAGINFLPAYPLDGGRVLRAALARHMSIDQATRYAVIAGQAFSMLFILVGIWNTWLMLVGFFLFVGAQLEERSILFQSVVQSVRMEEVMLTDFTTLSSADTLEDALSKAVHTLQDDFPVVRAGDLVGVISRQRIIDALRSNGNAYVQSEMSRAFEVAQRSESLASAFRKLTSRGLTLIPVVEGERLVGIVTLQNLMHSMGLLAESRRLRERAEED